MERISRERKSRVGWGAVWAGPGDRRWEHIVDGGGMKKAQRTHVVVGGLQRLAQSAMTTEATARTAHTTRARMANNTARPTRVGFD